MIYEDDESTTCRKPLRDKLKRPEYSFANWYLFILNIMEQSSSQWLSYLNEEVMRRPLTMADVGLATSDPSFKYETPNSTTHLKEKLGTDVSLCFNVMCSAVMLRSARDKPHSYIKPHK